MPEAISIIFLAYQPLTKKFEQDFYTERIIQEGFKIEYWDVSNLFGKKAHAHIIANDIITKIISSFQQLNDEIIRSKTSLFIFHINYYAEVYKLFRAFSRQNVQTAFFARGALPFPSARQTTIRKFFIKFSAFKSRRYFKSAISNQLAILARKAKLVKPFTYVFYAGSESLPVIGYGYNYGLEKSKLIALNSFDYDKYIEIKGSESYLSTTPYCVFLDVYLPFHPDFDLLGIPKVDAEKYYASLNNYFDKIEAVHNIRVVIAAHPKSDYEYTNFFKGRLSLKNKTAELIKDANFIIVHASTSISFAVLFNKPIIFIYNNEIKNLYRHGQYSLLAHFAKILNAPCINIDKVHDITFDLPAINTVVYSEYKYKYLTNPESEQQSSVEIFSKFLKEQLPA